MTEHEEMELAMDDVAENTETDTVEENAGQDEQVEMNEPGESEKKFSQEEVDQIVGRRLAREREKMNRETEKKYGELERVLRAGTGLENVGDMAMAFRESYEKKGIDIPKAPAFDDRDVSTLAKADADEIIEAGYDEVIEELDKLAEKGADKMTKREQQVFARLCDYKKAQDGRNELIKMGLKPDVIDSKEFKDYAAMFNSTIPLSKVYEMYAKETAKPVENIGSLTNNAGKEPKTYYSPEEVDKLTAKDYEDPVVMKNVRESMLKWKK